MSLFPSHSSYLGIDIGSASIKVVELKNEGGQPRLMTYGFTEEMVDIVHDNSEKTQDKVAALLTKICEQARVTTKKTVAALPSFSVFSSIISLPAMNKKDMAKAIYWQAKKFVPMPLEEMTLDWKLLDESLNIKASGSLKGQADTSKDLSSQEGVAVLEPKEETEGKDSNGEESQEIKKDEEFKEEFKKDDEKGSKKALRVLIAAAPKKLVMRYISVFKKADLELLSLETENFALERSLVGGDKTPVMIVDIGDVSSDISVVENGIPVLSRSVDAGGRSITRAVVNSMNVDEKRAEQFKRDIGFMSSQGNLPKIIESVMTPIINEIKYCFDLYASKQSHQRIEKIILTGGSAFLPNIDQYLSQLLQIKVFIGDPWARVIYPVELKPVLDELAPRFSVAVGLAMREIV